MTAIDQLKMKFPSPDFWVMRDAFFDHESGGQVHTRNKTLIQSALENEYKALAKKMAECRPSSRCRNPYCDQCQRDLFANQKKRFNKFLITPYKNDDAKARENLFFITILHELVPFDQPDDTIIRFVNRRGILTP
jgi:hypothetical protein